jgi:hypothetical protein
MFSAALLLSALASPALADDVVAESDTGIVFGDLDCRIAEVEVGEPRFAADIWDYLSVSVAVDMLCVDRFGVGHRSTGYDTVIFPTPTFDWATQSWVVGGEMLAVKRDFRTIELNPDLDVNVWSFSDETHTAFKVQFKKIPDAR